MGAGIELLTGVLRIGSEWHKYGDPFQFSCSFVKIGDVGNFIGASSDTIVSLVSERENIRALLKSLGVKKVRWSHIKDGVEVWREYPV